MDQTRAAQGGRLKKLVVFSSLSMLALLVACQSTGVVPTVNPTVVAPEETREEQIKDSYKKHAALAQLYRWYQIYENSAVPVANQLDILAPDIIVKSTLGEAVGHAMYEERLKQIPSTWKNAHFVKDPKFTLAADGRITIDLDISYLNTGINEDGSVRSADLSYTTELEPSTGILPKFTKIEIMQNSSGTAETFRNAYYENRLKSLMHYWLALIEDPQREAEPVQELLAPGFSLNFSSGKITNFAAFKEWLDGTASQVAFTIHETSNFSYEVLDECLYKMNVDFDWEGIRHDGEKMTAKTRHTWLVSDRFVDRFAKIKTMDVEVLEPFALKE